MTIIYDMVKGNTQSEQGQQTPTAGNDKTVADISRSTTLLEVQAIEAGTGETEYCIHHIRSLLRKS